MLLLSLVDSRNHDGLQWLAHLDVNLAAQGQNHRSDLLCHLHASLEILINLCLVGYWELIQVY